MSARSIDEPHRAASQLELLFDLTFVVAVASVTVQLAHAIDDGHALAGIIPFLEVFFAIWWAWMNFTWFASSFDNDDVPYRLLTLVQMAGVLVLAAGVPRAAADGDFRLVTVGYLIMRTGLVALWLRAAKEDPPSRATARRYALGISIAQVAWLGRLFLDDAGALPPIGQQLVFVALVVLELCVPPWAERRRPTTWHPHHIAERYGLFTIILLGEGVLAASIGVDEVLADGGVEASFVLVAAAGLVLVFALWWLYFLQPCGDGLARHRGRSYLWGYAHYGIFAALAALGAGVKAAVRHAGGQSASSSMAVGYGVAIPVAGFLAFLWVVNRPIVPRLAIRPAVTVGAVSSVLVLPLAAPFTGSAVVITAIAATCAAVVATTLTRRP